MPAVLREGPYRFFFYSGDGEEPQHVLFVRDDRVRKSWLNPVRMQRSGGLRRSEIRRIQPTIEANRKLLIEARSVYVDD